MSTVDSRNALWHAPCQKCGNDTGYVHPIPDEWMVRRGYLKRRLCDGLCLDCTREMYTTRRREHRAATRANRPCETCGDTFTPPRADGRYCSDACRQRAYRARHHKEQT
jgi:hypothetical protein